jgi:hypothetical protein
MHSNGEQRILPFVFVFSMLSAAACGTSSAPTPSPSSGEPSQAAPASTPGTSDSPEAPGPQPVCSGDCYVLVEQTAALRLRPSADAPALAQEPDDALQTGRRRIPFRYVGEKDGWVELETLPARGGAYHADESVLGGEGDLGTHCYEGAVLARRGLGVHLYVQRDDLETVTTRAVRVEFPDRTAVALAAGVVVEPLPASGVHRVKMSHLEVELALPADSVGAGYVASPLPRAASGRGSYLTDGSLAAGALAYGQGKIVALTVPPANALSQREYPISAGQELDAGRRLVTIQQPCIEITGIVDSRDAFSRGDAPLASLGAIGARTKILDVSRAAGDTTREVAATPVLRAGASLYWSHGQPAGRAIEDVRLDQAPAAAGERHCQRFERDHRLHGLLLGLSAPEPKPPGEPLELCFAAADVSTSWAPEENP